MVSREFVICPYCKADNLKNIVLGSSGLVNVGGTERMVECRKCGEEFSCEVQVDIKYKTRKFSSSH